jgi:DNA (cytosine-5)-methyltransferase 1
VPAYYNDIDSYVAQWLRNLIAAGIIAPGDVDERNIADVRPDELVGYEQCHFFAGIGGWSYALRRAGWSADRPVWTGSCPCQPFSVAGLQKSFEDSRHLWPNWRELIAERRPATIFGEQVANAPQWVRVVRGDLEALAYAVGCIPIEAASAGAHHFRDRYWFVADRDGVWERQSPWRVREQRRWPEDGSGGFGLSPVADRDSERSQIAISQPSDVGSERKATSGNGIRDVADAEGDGWGEGWTEDELRCLGPAATVCSVDGCQVIKCSDGKWRRLPPPRVRWLGARLPARISRLRAFGNAIDPRPAVSLIGAFMECRP